ncbi:hypothetical protein ABZ023_33515, partial [Streptomyces sp. NPDC006367]
AAFLSSCSRCSPMRSRARSPAAVKSVQRLDPADKQHNDRRLDTQVWEIAEALRAYSRVAKSEPASPVSAVVERALEPRRRILRTSLSSIGQRVEALEHYATQIAEAEERRRELRQLRCLSAGTDDLLGLLAATAHDDLAVAEIEGMSDEAARALDLFNEALQAAQGAADLALPGPDGDQHARRRAAVKSGDHPMSRHTLTDAQVEQRMAEAVEAEEAGRIREAIGFFDQLGKDIQAEFGQFDSRAIDAFEGVARTIRKGAEAAG